MIDQIMSAQYEDWEHWWECPSCGEGHAEDFDIRNTTLTCPACGEKCYAGMQAEDHGLPEAIDNDVRYKWTCPSCDLLNYEEFDCRGNEVTCECGVTSIVSQ